MNHILKCLKCRRYTMEEICACGEKTSVVRPAKFSPEDAYASYRREAKRDKLRKEGLL